MGNEKEGLPRGHLSHGRRLNPAGDNVTLSTRILEQYDDVAIELEESIGLCNLQAGFSVQSGVKSR